MIKLTIDGAEYEAEDGMTVLEVARANNVAIPTLCFHPALKPFGSCRLCAVEVARSASGRPTAMLSCILKAKNGLAVHTTGETVARARSKAFRNLLTMAPQSERIIELARVHGIDPGPPPDGCVRCRLCIRVCKEIVGPGALRMEKHDGMNYVVPIEGKCIGCGTYANICPTRVIHIEDKDNVRTISIRDEIIGRHPLERCEGCGKLYATPKFLAHIEQRTTEHPHTKTVHHYCPTCTKLFSDRIQSVREHTRK